MDERKRNRKAISKEAVKVDEQKNHEECVVANKKSNSSQTKALPRSGPRNNIYIFG